MMRVKAIEFHHRRHGEAISLHPSAEGLTGVRPGIDHETRLLQEPEFEAVGSFWRGE